MFSFSLFCVLRFVILGVMRVFVYLFRNRYGWNKIEIVFLNEVYDIVCEIREKGVVSVCSLIFFWMCVIFRYYEEFLINLKIGEVNFI